MAAFTRDVIKVVNEMYLRPIYIIWQSTSRIFNVLFKIYIFFSILCSSVLMCYKIFSDLLVFVMSDLLTYLGNNNKVN